MLTPVPAPGTAAGPARGHVLVTGAAGFIGSHLVRRLRAEGHRVVGVDAHRGTTTPAIAARRLAEPAHDPGFDLVDLDLAHGDLTRLATRTRARAIFHLAGRPGARDGDRTALDRDNVRATANVVAAAEAAAVPRLVFSSSSSVYGDAGAHGACREGDPVTPLSHYGETKRAAELLCLNGRLRSTVVRFFTVYGPHQRTDMAFERFIAAARSGRPAPVYQPGAVGRDFTHVSDAVEGMLLAWRHGVAPVYNISGGRVVDLATAWRTIEELTGAPLRMQPAVAAAEPSWTHADLTLARADLGYRPRMGLRDGLDDQLAATLCVAAA